MLDVADVAEAPAATTWQQRLYGALVDVGHNTVARGLLIRAGGNVYILTASHALPYVPDNLAPLPQILSRPGKRPTVGASVLFADQVADIALLGHPLSNPVARDEYDTLAQTAVAIALGSDVHTGPVAMPPRLETDPWLHYEAASVNRRLHLTGPTAETKGLSGSPVFDVHRRLVGVHLGRAIDRACAASVAADLPVWFMRALEADMAEFTDPTVFAMQAIHVANTPSRRAMGYRLIADMFDAHLITHDAAQQLLDTLDRRSVMGEVLGMDPAQ